MYKQYIKGTLSLLRCESSIIPISNHIYLFKLNRTYTFLKQTRVAASLTKTNRDEQNGQARTNRNVEKSHSLIVSTPVVVGDDHNGRPLNTSRRGERHVLASFKNFSFYVVHDDRSTVCVCVCACASCIPEIFYSPPDCSFLVALVSLATPEFIFAAYGTNK